MKVNFQIEGLSELQHTVERTKVGFVNATKRATRTEAEEIMNDSRTQVPVDTETLKNSAFVEQGEDGSVTFGYGKDNPYNPKKRENVSDYMVAVHERLDVNHPTGKAKFLEDPVNAHAAKLESSLVAKIRSFLGI